MTTDRFGPGRPLRFGTRGSALALAQTNLAIARLHAAHPDLATDVRVVRTEGDLDRISPLTEIGGRGVFTNAIERAILEGQVAAAVHSTKDLPTALHPSLPIVAFPDRDDPRDVLVSRHDVPLDELPANPTIGTSSRRREVQIRRLRPDARLMNIRGNVDTRLRKAEGPKFDAIVVAAAGILRMGWGERICQYFDIDQLVPSPGQGAIAVQARHGSNAARLIAATDDPVVSGPVLLERVFLAAIGAGCAMPVGAHVRATGEYYRIVAMLADPSGDRIAFADEPLALGDEPSHVAEIAARMLTDVGDQSNRQIWNGWVGESDVLCGARVVVTRPRLQSGQLMAALADRGAEPLSLPTIRVEPVADTTALDAALEGLAGGAFDWIVFTSGNAVDVLASRLATLAIEFRLLGEVKVAAVGPATAAAARAAGLDVAVVSDVSDATHLAVELLDRLEVGARILYPRSAIGRDDMLDALADAGFDVVSIDAYRTVPESDVDPRILNLVLRGAIDAIAFSSPSSVRNLVAMLGDDAAAVLKVPAVCAGPVTAEAARAAGFVKAAVSDDPGAAAMAETLAAHWGERADRRQVQRDGRMMPVELVTKGNVG
jgi:hydroxymethylbilane synthase